MADYSFGLGKNKPAGTFVDQTLIGTPIPVTTSTVDKKISENFVDGARLMRLDALRSRASWISNMESPRMEPPPKEKPLSDFAKNDHSEASRSSSSKAATGRKSTESFQSILNLQTMEDLSGSVIDANIGSERVSSANPMTLRIDVEKGFDFREHLEGNKENTFMPCVGISPGDSLQNEEEDEILRTRHDSADIGSFEEDLTLNWDEITRPPSPPVKDRSCSQPTSKSPRWANDPIIPSRLLSRTEAAALLPASSVEASSSSQRRLESILASDNSELSSFSLSGGSGVRLWVRNMPSATSDAFRPASSKTSPQNYSSEHRPSVETSNIGSLRSRGSLMLELENTPNRSFSYSENFDAQRVTSSSSWLAQPQIKDDFWQGFVASRENANILSGVGLSSDNTATFPSVLSPASAAPDRMASIREEEAVEEVTITDDNTSQASPVATETAADPVGNNETLSVSALQIDSASVAASRQSRGMQGHPLASSTVASLTASMASLDDGSSLVNLSDIRHALDNDLWESHGPSGVASFVEHRAKEERRKKKEQQKKASTASKDSSTMRASSGETVRPSVASPVARWVSLRESIRGSPPARRTQEDFVDLAASSLGRSAANDFITSLASSQVTALKVSNINRNNNNVNGNCRETSDAEDVVLNCVAQLVFPSEVPFPGVCLKGCQTERSFSLTNRCPRTVSCQLEVIYCAVNGEPLVREVARSIFPVRPSVVLGSGATRTVRVFFKPHRAGAFAAELRITPDHSPAADVVVNLSARAEAPQLRLLLNDQVPCEEGEENQRRLDFGPMPWGACRMQRLVLMNESQAELPVVARLAVTSRLALRCFGLRGGEGGLERQMELTVERSGGCAELELCCQMPEAEEETEQAVLAQATLAVSLQSLGQDVALEPLAALPVRATAGVVRLAVPRHLSVVRLSERCRRAAVPLRNEGSLPAAVRLALEPQPSSGDAAALRLLSRAKATIAPGDQTLVQLSYEGRRSSHGADRVSGTLFALVEPSGPVFEVPVQFDPAEEASVGAAQKPPLVASKTHLLWAGVAVGSSEQQRLVLENTTDRPLSATLCVEALQDAADARGTSGGPAFFLSHPKTAAACRRLRLELRPGCDSAVRVSFRPAAPRYSRARLLIRLPSHNTTFIVGLRGSGGCGHLVCASGGSGPDGILVASHSSRPLVLYNRGDRGVWVETESRPDCCVQPASFFVPANSSKKVLLRSSERLHAAWDATLRFRYGDEVLRAAALLCSGVNWPASLEDAGGSAAAESLPVDDRDLPWRQVLTAAASELAVRLTERRARWDGGDSASLLDDSSCSGDPGAALRETMVRVAHWSGAEARLEACGAAAGARSDSRAKPHVEEWLRQQQELTTSQLTSTTTFGKSLLRILTPLEVEFAAVGGPQERSLEWLNASAWPVSWRLRAAGPLRCENASCAGSGAAFSFSPVAVSRLPSGALQRVRLSCAGGCPGPHRQQWHLTATAMNTEEEGEEEEEEESSVRRQESHAVLLTLRANRAGAEAGKSRLLVRQREVRFPLCRVHSRVERKVKVTNRSSQPVTALFRALPEPFLLGDRAPSQLVLKAAHYVNLPLVFRPTERGRFEAALGIECPEVPAEPPIRVLLTGEAED